MARSMQKTSENRRSHSAVWENATGIQVEVWRYTGVHTQVYRYIHRYTGIQVYTQVYRYIHRYTGVHIQVSGKDVGINSTYSTIRSVLFTLILLIPSVPFRNAKSDILSLYR